MANSKRPYGLTILPWQERISRSPGTSPSLAVPYVSGFTPGAAAELAASRKCEKYMSARLLYLPAYRIRKFGHSKLVRRCSHFFTWAQDMHQV